MTAAPPVELRTDEHLLDEYEAERPGRRLSGFASIVVDVLCVGLVLFAIYWVLNPIAVACAVSAVAVAGLAVALGGWLRGPVALPARVVIGAGSIVLLYLEPLWIAIGLGLVAVGLAAHVVLSRGGPHPAGTNDGP